MKSTLFLVAILGSGFAVLSSQTTSPEAALQHRIQKVIKLMEQEEYEKFLTNFYPPAEVESLRKRHNIKKLARYFGEGPQRDYLLNYLKSVQHISPRFNSSKTEARFAAEEFEETLVWDQVDGNWYLRN